jgi:hypothetical protein
MPWYCNCPETSELDTLSLANSSNTLPAAQADIADTREEQHMSDNVKTHIEELAKVIYAAKGVNRTKSWASLRSAEQYQFRSMAGVAYSYVLSTAIGVAKYHEAAAIGHATVSGDEIANSIAVILEERSAEAVLLTSG